MKKQKIILLVFAVLAFIGLGIGYAALTDTLSLTATVSGTGVNDTDISDSEAFDIVWTAREPQETQVAAATRPTLTGIATLDPNDDDVATISVEGMLLKGDTVVFVFDIENTSEYTANLELIPEMDGEVALQLENASVKVTPVLANTTLAADGITTLTVTIELQETQFAAFNINEIKYSIIATAAE